MYVRILDKDSIVNASKPITVQLTEVPSTVSWAGNILPNTTTPELRKAPIVLTIPADEQWTDSLSTDGTSFKISSMNHHTVIPAHRGRDFWNADGTMNDKPADILEHKMKIALTTPTDGARSRSSRPRQSRRCPAATAASSTT